MSEENPKTIIDDLSHPDPKKRVEALKGVLYRVENCFRVSTLCIRALLPRIKVGGKEWDDLWATGQLLEDYAGIFQTARVALISLEDDLQTLAENKEQIH